MGLVSPFRALSVRLVVPLTVIILYHAHDYISMYTVNKLAHDYLSIFDLRMIKQCDIIML